MSLFRQAKIPRKIKVNAIAKIAMVKSAFPAAGVVAAPVAPPVRGEVAKVGVGVAVRVGVGVAVRVPNCAKAGEEFKTSKNRKVSLAGRSRFKSIPIEP